MKTYELLFIIPGTLTEEEVAPQVATIESLVQAIEATDVETKSLGKAKLAYPMNHIRYGYFYTTTFTVNPAAVPELQRQLNLQKGYLRTIINIALDTTLTRDNAPDALITIEKKQDLIDERKKSFARYKEDATPVQSAAPKKVSVPEVPVAVTEVAAPEKEVINMEDIDKRLDDIIAGDDITENL
jgi:small subunit ribosomal protein S6